MRFGRCDSNQALPVRTAAEPRRAGQRSLADGAHRATCNGPCSGLSLWFDVILDTRFFELWFLVVIPLMIVCMVALSAIRGCVNNLQRFPRIVADVLCTNVFQHGAPLGAEEPVTSQDLGEAANGPWTKAIWSRPIYRHSPASPFFLAGGIKVLYDLLLYRSFVTLRPPAEQH